MASSKLQVTRPTQRMVTDIGYCLRQADIDEVWAMSHLKPMQATQMSYEASAKCWVALWDGIPTVIFGVARTSYLPSIGSPWMLATDRISEMGTTFVRGSIKYVNFMQEGHELLRNYVDVRNKVSIKWLKWLGFNLLDPKPYGPDGCLFHEFYKGA
jgi:hypothetical protein